MSKTGNVQGADNQPRRRVKITPESMRMDLFGDMLKFSRKSLVLPAPYRKYDAFAESLVAQPKETRLLMYRFICGMALTAHARRTLDPNLRREIYDLKNELYLSIANHAVTRRLVGFRRCVDRRFKVTNYCDDCKTRNTELGIAARQWKYCSQCKLDLHYYDLISIYHRHDKGHAVMFLSNDQAKRIVGQSDYKRVPSGRFNEEVTFSKFVFSSTNLFVFDLKTIQTVSLKLLQLCPIVLPITIEPRSKIIL